METHAHVSGSSLPSARPLLILGTGPYAADIADVATEIQGVAVAGFVEGIDRSRCAERFEGLPVYWVDDLARLAAGHRFIGAIGTTRRSGFIRQAEEAGCEFITLVHPFGRVSVLSSLATGVVLNAGVLVAAHAHLGRHVSVNRGASIGHHTQIDEFVTVGPGANIAGHCHIGSATYIGIGATVIDHISIGQGCVVGAGAVVTEKVPDRVLVVGVPARIVKRDIEGF